MTDWLPIEGLEKTIETTPKGEAFLTDGNVRFGVRWDGEESEMFDLPGLNWPVPTHYFLIPPLPPKN